MCPCSHTVQLADVLKPSAGGLIQQRKPLVPTLRKSPRYSEFMQRAAGLNTKRRSETLIMIKEIKQRGLKYAFTLQQYKQTIKTGDGELHELTTLPQDLQNLLSSTTTPRP